MGKFEGILICTDLDGTLLRNDKSISEENKNAIEYFKQEGGLFTFVTGRLPFYLAGVDHLIEPNTYYGCMNGGALYDYAKQGYVWTSVLENEVVELIRCIDEKCPNVGIQVNTLYDAYFCKDNPAMQAFRRVTNLPNISCDYRTIREPMVKILFGSCDEDEISQIEYTLKNHILAERFSFVRSEQTLFEILPKGVGKGMSIERLSEYLHLSTSKIIAIGDYDNDVPMLQAAGVGIAVSNASKSALAVADYITVSNEEHAVARVISDLEKGIIIRSI